MRIRIPLLIVLALLLLAAGLVPVSTPDAGAQEAFYEPADKLVIVTTPALAAVANEYGQARQEAYGWFNPTNRRVRKLDYEVLTVGQCMSAHPGMEHPRDAVRAAVLERLAPAAMNIAKADPEKPALPGDDRHTFKGRLLLIGDVPPEGQPVDPERHVPCFYKRCELVSGNLPGVEGEIDDVPSDNPYACRTLDDDVPLYPVGRLPVENAGQVRAYLAAVTEYENNPPPGAWKGKVTLFAGDPGFVQLGPQVRKLIEKAYEKAVIDNLDESCDVSLHYANPDSPYTWPAPDFGQKLVDEINDGAMFLNYLGHGWKDSCDTLKFNGRRYKVFTAREAALVDCRKGRPIAAFFTCYTGCYDMDRPSLAEALILNPRGPIGVMASSRVSNEINLLLEMAFLKIATKDRVPTLGDAFTRTKREMLTRVMPIPAPLAAGFGIPTHKGYSDGKRTHLWLYNLFGDPTVRLQQPQDVSNDLHMPETIASGRWLDAELMAHVRFGERVEARLEIDRERSLESVVALPQTGPITEVFEAMRQNHARVHTREVARTTAPAARRDESVHLRLNLPTDLPTGPYILRVFIYNGAGQLVGTGSRRVTMQSGDGSADF